MDIPLAASTAGILISFYDFAKANLKGSVFSLGLFFYSPFFPVTDAGWQFDSEQVALEETLRLTWLGMT